MADWRFSPQAQRELQSCRVDPPARVVRTYRFNETMELFDPQDPRVRRLKALREAKEPPKDTIEWRAWLSMNEQDAIRSAISQNRKAVAA